MVGFSSGDIAIAVCDRCHLKKPYTELRADGESPGLRVCQDDACWDMRDPWRQPRPPERPISLRFPRPDLQLTVPED